MFTYGKLVIYFTKIPILGADAFVLGLTLNTMDFLPHIMQIDRISAFLTAFCPGKPLKLTSTLRSFLFPLCPPHTHVQIREDNLKCLQNRSTLLVFLWWVCANIHLLRNRLYNEISVTENSWKFKYMRHLEISGTNQRCETLYLFSLPSYSGGLHHRCSHFRNEQSQRPGEAHINTKICTSAPWVPINKDFFENYVNVEYKGGIWNVNILKGKGPKKNGNFSWPFPLRWGLVRKCLMDFFLQIIICLKTI